MDRDECDKQDPKRVIKSRLYSRGASDDLPAPTNAAHDVAECVRIIREHPVIGPRYGKAISHLHTAWLHVLKCEAKAASVLEEGSGRKTRICFAGVSVFVRDEFVRGVEGPSTFLVRTCSH